MVAGLEWNAFVGRAEAPPCGDLGKTCWSRLPDGNTLGTIIGASLQDINLSQKLQCVRVVMLGWVHHPGTAVGHPGVLGLPVSRSIFHGKLSFLGNCFMRRLSVPKWVISSHPIQPAGLSTRL